MNLHKLRKTIQYNCDISDARDSGIYSVCSLILKLRNLYKWENNFKPWQEPESAVLLDWIADKEDHWETLSGADYRLLAINGQSFDPFDAASVNAGLADPSLFYGAGYGRSMKSVFFLGKIAEKRKVAGFPVVILEKEYNRELSSPFAFSQEQTVFIRKDPLRFFFWDQLQEIQPSNKKAIYHALRLYDLLNINGGLDPLKLRQRLDSIIDFEMAAFIYHEVGELQDNPVSSETLQKIVRHFHGTSIEFITRSIKDILADTHELGMLGHIIKHRKTTSLCFYVGFLDNLRKHLFPEIIRACHDFIDTGDWEPVEQARRANRELNSQRAGLLNSIMENHPDKDTHGLHDEIERRLIAPLGL